MESEGAKEEIYSGREIEAKTGDEGRDSDSPRIGPLWLWRWR